jgi:hypothetical protein
LPLVEQKLLTILENLWCSLPVFNGVRIAHTSVFCIVFCRSLFVHLSFLFCHYIVYPCGFWLPFWYLQTLLKVSDGCWLCWYLWVYLFFFSLSDFLKFVLHSSGLFQKFTPSPVLFDPLLRLFHHFTLYIMLNKSDQNCIG